MGLSDCSECWNTPCTCGHVYKGYSISSCLRLIDELELNIIKELEKIKTKDFPKEHLLENCKRSGILKGDIIRVVGVYFLVEEIGGVEFKLKKIFK